MSGHAAMAHHEDGRMSASSAGSPPSASMLRQQVHEVQRRLVRMLRGRAALLALAAGCAVTAALVLLLAWVARPLSGSAVAITLVSGMLAAALAWWRVRAQQPAVTPVRAALWIEERSPSAHALVTLVEHAPGALSSATEARLAQRVVLTSTDARTWLQRAQRHSWRGPGVLAGALLLVVIATVRLTLVGTNVSTARATAGQTSGASTSDGARSTRASRLTPWRVEVTPPAYARLATRALVDSTTIRALPGSRIRVAGEGPLEGLRAEWLAAGADRARDTMATARVIAMRAEGRRWMVDVIMPSRVAGVRVRDAAAGTDRVLALVPQPDSLPQVQLLAPAQDAVQRDSTGELLLRAVASDDLGLASVRFELIVTSGSGERYTARTVVLGTRQLTGTRRDSLKVRTTLEALGLVAGDVVHMRAVARDRHPAADREAGVSETRSLRIARADEFDSVAVEAAPPPPVDSSMLSQRMLLMLTERLDARRPRLTREALVSESRRLAVEQARIRRAVSAIVFQRLSGDGEAEHVHSEGDGHDHGLVLQAGKLVPSTGGASLTVMPGATPPPSLAAPLGGEGGESPIVGINRPLLEAYNHMWDAGRALELADPAAALPPMRLALDAIQRARAAERVYLRGRVRPIVVDLARVRLAGRDTGQSSVRRSGAPLEQTRAVWDARLRRAALRLADDATSARDSLLALRLDALGTDAAFADALDAVLQQWQRGTEATDALVRARRLLAPPQRLGADAAWGTP